MNRETMRLNRFLAHCGHGSRRSCDELIRSGRVSINKATVTHLSTRVHPGDEVRVDGRLCRPPERLVLMLHKPRGVICSRVDLTDRPTVFQLLPAGLPQLFYVGRLDLDSEGLLIMTNDGDLAERISHPRNKLPKVYEVRLDRPFDPALRPALLRGIETEYGTGKMEAVDVIGGPLVRVVLSQGLKRQIRLMFRKVGFKVLALKRTQIGGLKLGHLRPGQWRRLEERELRALEAVDLSELLNTRLVPKASRFTGQRASGRRRPSLKSRFTDLEQVSGPRSTRRRRL